MSGRPHVQEACASPCLRHQHTPHTLHRVGFKGGPELWVEDCLNLGVSPLMLVEMAKQKFIGAGGVLLEGYEFKAADVYEDGVEVQLKLARQVRGELIPRVLVGYEAVKPTREGMEEEVSSGTFSQPISAQGKAFVGDANRPNNNVERAPPAASPSGFPLPSTSLVTETSEGSPLSFPSEWTRSSDSGSDGERRAFALRSRLLIDCMGHFGPILKQIRGGSKPEGVVMVVGSCAEGESELSSSTLTRL